MTTPKPSRNWPVIAVIGLLVVFGGAFIVVMATWQAPQTEPSAADEPTLAEAVAAVLTAADPVRGEQHLTTYACAACHIAGAANNVAPGFVGIADTAATRRPPLTAAEYLYESIIDPSAYVVEGYPDVMIGYFASRAPAQDIGDMVAYLLTLTADPAQPEATTAP